MKSRVVFGCLLAVIMSVSSVLSITTARATPLEPDWFGGSPIIKKSDRSYSTEGCVNEMRQVTINPLNYYLEVDRNPKSWCVYHYKGFDITFYQRWFSNVVLDATDTLGMYPREESGMAISFDDGPLTPVDNISYGLGGAIKYAPGTERPIFVMGCVWRGCEMRVYDFLSHITSTKDPGTGFYRYVAQQDEEWALRYENGEKILTDGLGVSDNGEWVSFAVRDIGLVRLSMLTYKWEIVDVGNYGIPSWFGGYMARTSITDDGKLIAYTGSLNDPRIVRYTEGCGTWVPSRLDEGNSYRTNLETSCLVASLFNTLVSVIRMPSGHPYPTDYLHLSGDGAHMRMRTYDFSQWYEIYPANSQIDSKITYLALGDSFSSGEGDMVRNNGITHYLPGTNVLGTYSNGVPRELCHVSDRSYPFLLAKDMGISRGNDMQSIACSGAVRDDIYTNSPTSSYFGQPVLQFDGATRPRLQGLENASSLRESALQNFIPGRVRQIEMLKKYKPKVATIGVSGNDLGFAQILMECMTNTIEQPCNYAHDEGLKSLGAAIQANYQHQVELYTALKQASPGTDFYAVGYPQFIDGTKVSCWEILGMLNQQERIMINKSLSYANQTIKNAAAAVDIKYINIENAISSSNGDMCAESGMITDPADKVFSASLTSVINRFEDGYAPNSRAFPIRLEFVQDIKNINRNFNEGVYANVVALTMQEAFHPNARAHQAMYDYIHSRQTNSSLLNDGCDGDAIVCPADANKIEPEVPVFFGKTVHTEFMNMVRVDDGTGQRYIRQTGLTTAERGKVMQVIADESLNNPGSMADIVIRSEPRKLGSVQVGEGGTFSASVALPLDMPVGYHVLSVEGMAGSESSKYIQTVFVMGSQGDIDGDGIDDADDTCEFLTPSGKDTDGDRVDDSCDLYNLLDETPLTVSENRVGSANTGLDFTKDNGATDWSALAVSGVGGNNSVTPPHISAVNLPNIKRDDGSLTLVEIVLPYASLVIVILSLAYLLIGRGVRNK